MARQLFLPATATLLLSFFLSFFFSTPPPPPSPPPPLQLGRQGATIASRLIPVARVPLPLLCLASRPPPVLDPLHKMTTATAAGSSQEKAAAAAGGSVADRIMPHLLNIYGSSATARDFEIYAANATFEDPLMRAHGVKQIKSAFYTLPKVFGESKITEYTVQENPMGPGKTEVVIQNKQHYKVLGKPVDLTSLIRLQLQDGKVVKHEDWWHGKPLKNRDTVALPLVGRLAESSRRGAMLLTHALMGFGKDPTQPPPPPPSL